jgi:hypothetical protein
VQEGVVIMVYLQRHNRRKFDAVNAAIGIKWFEDILVEQGVIKDDEQNEIHIYPSVYDCGLVETMVKFEVYT